MTNRHSRHKEVRRTSRFVAPGLSAANTGGFKKGISKLSPQGIPKRILFPRQLRSWGLLNKKPYGLMPKQKRSPQDFTVCSPRFERSEYRGVQKGNIQIIPTGDSQKDPFPPAASQLGAIKQKALWANAKAKKKSAGLHGL